MNPAYAKILAYLFFFSIGTYQVARGIANIRSRRESSFWGWFRVVLGAILLLLPIPLYLYLLSGTGT